MRLGPEVLESRSRLRVDLGRWTKSCNKSPTTLRLYRAPDFRKLS